MSATPTPAIACPRCRRVARACICQHAHYVSDDRLLERSSHPTPLDLGIERDDSDSGARNHVVLFSEQWLALPTE